MKRCLYLISTTTLLICCLLACKGNSFSHDNDNILDSMEKAKQDSINAMKEIQTRVEDIYRNVFNYEDYEEGRPYDPDKKYMSSEYKRLLAEAENGSEDLVLDCDHWTCSQDPLKPSMRILSVEKKSKTEAIAHIVVTDSGYCYEGKYHEESVKLILIKEKDIWLVDDFITKFENEEFSEKDYLKQTIKENELAKVRKQYDKLEYRRKSLVREYQETLAYNAKLVILLGYIPQANTNELVRCMDAIMDVCSQEVKLAEKSHDAQLLREAKATQDQMMKLVN